LRHGALALDRANDVLYVLDDTQPTHTEEPAAQVDAFTASTGAYLGVLEYQIVDALPSGIAVDNSPNFTQGRVYVTSGNTDQAGIYAYAAGSLLASSQPPTVGLTVFSAGAGTGAVTSSLGGLDCASSCSAQIRSGATLTLSATADPGSSFAGWSAPGCEGVGECTLAMDEAKSVSAEFDQRSPSSTPGLAAAAEQTSSAAPAQPPVPAGAPKLRSRHRHRHRRAHRESR
jgi:hypothetical protein